MKIDTQLKDALIQWSDAVRNSVERCHISYMALQGTVAKLKSESEKLEGLYKKIMEMFCPNIADVSDYTFEIHRCFIQATLHEVLNKMDAFYENYTKQ